MSLNERIDSIGSDVADSHKGVFAKKRDEFLKLSDPNDKQITAFTAHLEKAETRQKERDDIEAKIIEQWDIYTAIVNDPNYPHDVPILNRSEEKLRKGFEKHTREGSSITSSTVGLMSLKAVNTDVFVKLWEKEKGGTSSSGGRKSSTKRPAPTGKLDTIRKKLNTLIPQIKLIIGTNPEVSNKVDELNNILKSDDGSFDDAKALYDELEKHVPQAAGGGCCGEDCNSVNSPLNSDGLCRSCARDKIVKNNDDIIKRHQAFKDIKEEILFRRVPRNATDEEIESTNLEKAKIKQILLDIKDLRGQFDDAFGEFMNSKGKEGYESCMSIYEELHAMLPTKIEGKTKKKYSPYKDNNDDIIGSDESSAESSESSVYESDSSSSHEGQRMRKEREEKKKPKKESSSENLTGEILSIFSKYPEIKQLSTIYASGDIDQFRKELQTVKESMPRYKVTVFDRLKNDEPQTMFADMIHYSEEDAQKRATEIHDMLNKDKYGYKIDRI